MELKELYYKLTGTENPRYITEEQKLVIDDCLKIINEIEPLKQPAVSGSYSREDMSKAWSEGYHRKVDEINGNKLRYFDVWLANYR